MTVRKLIATLAFATVAFGAKNDGLWVKIVNRQDNSSAYNYYIPGYSTTNANANATCFGQSDVINCSGTGRATTYTTPTRTGSYSVRGATFTLMLPDGRVAVVNCESKYKMKGDYVNRRSCRMPLVDQVFAEFNGDKAKLQWPVSLDGKKMASETYKIIAVVNKQQ